MLRWIMSFRNFLFDRNCILHTTSFELPIISVGNLAVGGTGKTPHTEYLLQLLQGQGMAVAVLSRGYGRRTKGFLPVQLHSTATEVGDEPLQIKQKYPEAIVAVCERRVVGVTKLLEGACQGRVPQVVLLDDAYQHRYIKPGFSILLTDYHRPYYTDQVMPWGRLRESASGSKRADVIVVTKCPTHLSADEAQRMQRQLHVQPQQRVFFTTFAYAAPRSFTTNETIAVQPQHLLVLTGIAKPEPLYRHFEQQGKTLSKLAFPDHHAFTASDVARINRMVDELPEGAAVVTTEKDAVRLKQLEGLNPRVLNQLLVQPITVEVLFGQQESFNKIILQYVRKN